MNIFHKRQGQMEVNDVYFYTHTIQGFKHLLADDTFKQVIMDSLSYFVQKNLIKLYGYVIMPNHIHLIWTHLALNGKETVAGSFTKYTAHQFKKMITKQELLQYCSDKQDRCYQFWKRDPLAIHLSSIKIIEQKLDYIHANPVNEKWKLCKLPEEYKWSSAGFYFYGRDEFGILTHYMD